MRLDYHTSCPVIHLITLRLYRETWKWVQTRARFEFFFTFNSVTWVLEKGVEQNTLIETLRYLTESPEEHSPTDFGCCQLELVHQLIYQIQFKETQFFT